MNKKIEIPNDWGNDPLSNILNDAHNNLIVAFSVHKLFFEKLMEIHNFFKELIDYLDRSPKILTNFLIYNAHSSFIGSTRLFMSGQLTQSYILNRSTLESAIYAFYVSQNPDSNLVWLNREHSVEDKKIMKDEFRMFELIKFLKSKDKGIYSVTNKLYQDTIDFGAHPNPNGILAPITLVSEETYEFNYFKHDEPFYTAAFKNVAQVNVCALTIFQKIFPQKFDISLLSDKLEKLKIGL